MIMSPSSLNYIFRHAIEAIDMNWYISLTVFSKECDVPHYILSIIPWSRIFTKGRSMAYLA